MLSQKTKMRSFTYPLPALLLPSMVLVQTVLTAEQLYHASVSNGALSGLYGGVIDHNVEETPQNLSAHGIFCAELLSTGFYKGLDIRSMGYDPFTNLVMIQLETTAYSRTTAFTTRICNEGPPVCLESEVQVFFTLSESKHNIRENAGPFAMWDNTIYLIVNRYEKDSLTRSVTHRIELRRLEGCEDYYPFSTNYAIDFDACSSLVAVVAQEVSHEIGVEMEDTLLVSRQLKIIPQKRGDEVELVFLTQVKNQTYNDDFDVEHLSMQLISVTESSSAKVLHEYKVPKQFGEMEFHHDGGIDFRDGTLCWSMLDRVLCADWTDVGGLKNVQLVVGPEQAITVCRVQGNKQFLNHVTTGVAVGRGGENLVVYFGCYANKAANGGAGVARRDNAGEITVLPLEDSGGMIYAGGMFIACRDDNPWVSATSKMHSRSMVPQMILSSIVLILTYYSTQSRGS